MAMQTTSDNAVLRSMGLNPSGVDNHYNVSLLPVRFNHLGSLGWGSTWEAEHSCNLYGQDGADGVVGGFEFTADNGKDSYRELLEVWEQRQVAA